MYPVRNSHLQAFLAHPGGPFFVRKDDGFLTIPKGEPDSDEDVLDAAKREFQEETGIVPTGPFIPLTPVKQKGGKVAHVWAFEGDYEDGKSIVSNAFTLEWPPGSRLQLEFPEIDRAEFFDVTVAKRKVEAAQDALIDELARAVARRA
jgi:predicted NUDIX family NTP pyrophosphohydrolase